MKWLADVGENRYAVLYTVAQRDIPMINLFVKAYLWTNTRIVVTRKIDSTPNPNDPLWTETSESSMKKQYSCRPNV